MWLFKLVFAICCHKYLFLDALAHQGYIHSIPFLTPEKKKEKQLKINIM